MDDGRRGGKGDVAGKMSDHERRAAASRESGRRRWRGVEAVLLFVVGGVVVVVEGVVDGERNGDGRGRERLK